MGSGYVSEWDDAVRAMNTKRMREMEDEVADTLCETRPNLLWDRTERRFVVIDA